MVSLVLKSFWLIAADPHRGRVHFITTERGTDRLALALYTYQYSLAQPPF
jgi:hypothetical protein